MFAIEKLFSLFFSNILNLDILSTWNSCIVGQLSIILVQK